MQRKWAFYLSGWVVPAVIFFSALLDKNCVYAQNYVCFYTNLNDICLRLLPQEAPGTVENFLTYVESGAYNGTLIHRSMENFIIQGGGYYRNPLGEAVPKNAPIPNEFGVSNTRGTVAMAKVEEVPDSATSQWFINLADNAANLDNQNGGFTVFAEVVRGMDVVDAIAGLPRYNLTSYHPVFSTIPAIPVSDSGVMLVMVLRAEATETLPEDPFSCSEKGRGVAVTEFCGSGITLPVEFSGALYQVTLALTATEPTIDLTLLWDSIQPMAETGQPRAVLTAADGRLKIPSMKIGDFRFTNLVLGLKDPVNFIFTIQGFDVP